MNLNTTSGEVLAELVGQLKLDRVSEHEFHGRSARRSLPFVFGGQLVAQALSAAYVSIPAESRVHSLHSYFVGAGDPTLPVEYHVDHIRDGQTFRVRGVTAKQGTRRIFVSTISFKPLQHGPSYARSMPSTQGAEQTRPLADWLHRHYPQLPDWWTGPMAVDLRYIEEPPHLLTEQRPRDPRQLLWMRASDTLPDDVRVHDCVLAFSTDLTLLDPVMLGHGLSWYGGDVRAASLDHAIWFHLPPRADEWMLYAQQSPQAGNGLGLAQANIYDLDGKLIASTVQQGFVRVGD